MAFIPSGISSVTRNIVEIIVSDFQRKITDEFYISESSIHPCIAIFPSTKK